MNNRVWQSYTKQFKLEAEKNGYSDNEIDDLLKYAHKLFSQEIPIIYDQIHFSLLAGYHIDFLRKISNWPKSFYRSFDIPKKSGGKRRIEEPLPSLKEVQWWILENILEKIPVSKFAKAYIKDRSIRANAFYHIGQKAILSMDIIDFFGSIKYERIYKLFYDLGYYKNVATFLANLCTLQGRLPQGAPTSPALSNICFRSLDKRISAFMVSHKIRYTRYADDMTFSGDFDVGMVIKFVRSVLNDEGYKVNEKKLRTRGRHQRQEVTGIVVNEKLQVSRNLRRDLRKSLYYIQKYGLESHLNHTNNDKANYIRHLLGQVNFVLFINPEDKEFKEYKKILHNYL